VPTTCITAKCLLLAVGTCPEAVFDSVMPKPMMYLPELTIRPAVSKPHTLTN